MLQVTLIYLSFLLFAFVLGLSFDVTSHTIDIVIHWYLSNLFDDIYFH